MRFVSFRSCAFLLLLISCILRGSHGDRIRQAGQIDSRNDTTGPGSSTQTQVEAIPAGNTPVQSSREFSLSSWGRTLRTIVIADIDGAEICGSAAKDWRTDLARFLGRVLGPSATILAWDERRAAREAYFPYDCRRCSPTATNAPHDAAAANSASEPFNCEVWFRQHDIKQADLVLVVGSGEEERCGGCAQPIRRHRHHGDLQWAAQQWWDGPGTRYIHLPLSTNQEVLQNKVAPFSQVIPDASWWRPMPEDVTMGCIGLRPNTTGTTTPTSLTSLVYLAGNSWQALDEFLEAADPRLLRNVRLEAVTTSRRHHRAQRTLAIAQQRGLNVSISLSLSPQALQRRLCQASGAIINSQQSPDPWPLQRALAAQLPVLITKESHGPKSLHRQPFVFTTTHRRRAKSLDTDLRAFLSYVEEHDEQKLQADVQGFVSRHLTPATAFGRLCTIMSICSDAEL